MIFNLMKCDVFRILKAKKTYICLVIMTAITFISFLDGEDFNLPASAFYFSMLGTDSHTYLLNLIISFFIFGGCFIEDFQAMNIRSQLTRVNPIYYVISKMVNAYLSGIFSFVISLLAACGIVSIFKNWFKSESMDFVLGTEFGFLYENENFIAYAIVVAFEWGLLSAMLISACQVVSLYISDVSLCASLTFTIAFVLNFLSVISGSEYTFLMYFHAMSHKITSSFSGLIYSIIISLSSLFVFTIIAMIRVTRRLSHE